MYKYIQLKIKLIGLIARISVRSLDLVILFCNFYFYWHSNTDTRVVWALNNKAFLCMCFQTHAENETHKKQSSAINEENMA